MPAMGEVEATLGLEEEDTCYNGVLYPLRAGHWYFVHRRNRAEPNGCGLDFLESRVLDRSFSPLSPWRDLGLPGTVWEDPRIFPRIKGWGVVVGGPSAEDGEWRRRAVYSAEIHLRSGELRVRGGTLRRLRLLDGDAPCEKNWLPFVADHSQLILYSVCPLIVLEVGQVDERNIWVHKVVTSDYGFDFPGAPCSCGTVPVRLSDKEFLTFFHAVKYPYLGYANSADRSLRALSHTRHYHMGACTFSSMPPFRILAATEEPIEYPGIYSAENRRVTRDDRVVFPASATLIGDEVLVSVGENDSCTKIVRFRLSSLRRSLRPAHVGSWPAVHSRPVPCKV